MPVATRRTVDAVVVGAGHHGLVAATLLADAGWDVVVLESRSVPGGAIASVERQGWILDAFSACHPLAVASPVLRGLDLDVEWAHAPRPVAHVTGGSGAVVERTAAATAAALGDPRDGDQWLRLVAAWERLREPFLDALLTQWPPTTSALRVLRAAGPDVLDLVRFLLLPLDRMTVELFHGQDARDLMAGNAMHADIPPSAPGSGLFGWIMTMLAQDVGFPSPRGGTQRLAQALAARATSAGVDIELDTPVARVVTSGGRAVGVVCADGTQVAARRAVVADTSAPTLYERLLHPDDVPPGLAARLDRFCWDLPTVKLNYRLSAPMPWRAPGAHGAGVVHAGRSAAQMGHWSADLEAGIVPQVPFALLGQMTTIDPTRSPAGTEALWAYTHSPRGHADVETAHAVVDRTEAMLDDLAPGWRAHVIDRWDQLPGDLAASDANLGDGAVGGGTMQLFQQAFWRPVTGLGGPTTHLDGLYLASAAVHPGGGVHGGAGYLAAQAVLHGASWWGRPLCRIRTAALERLYRNPPAIG